MGCWDNCDILSWSILTGNTEWFFLICQKLKCQKIFQCAIWLHLAKFISYLWQEMRPGINIARGSSNGPHHAAIFFHTLWVKTSKLVSDILFVPFMSVFNDTKKGIRIIIGRPHSLRRRYVHIGFKAFLREHGCKGLAGCNHFI